MALINCPECGKEISDMAKNCPNCGYCLSKREIKNNRICFILGIISFLIGVLFIFVNAFWILYGILFIISGIFNVILYKNRTYVIVGGMLYMVIALFSLMTIPAASGKYFVSACYIFYSIVFLVKGFINKTNNML